MLDVSAQQCNLALPLDFLSGTDLVVVTVVVVTISLYYVSVIVLFCLVLHVVYLFMFKFVDEVQVALELASYNYITF